MNKIKFMKLAIDLAKQGLGRTQTNPVVGCAIVKNGKIVGKGFHEKFGKSHAEINALRMAGRKAKGSTLYVTLEPCVHSGKGKQTPPCVPAILKAGVKKVIVSMKDPNPNVSGKGILELQKKGISVKVGVLEKEAKELNQAYLKWIQTKGPWIVQKIGISANGMIWSEEQKKSWINGLETRTFAHKLRNTLDGILIGAKTATHDNPKLTCRIKHGRNPVRIVLDPKLEISENAKLLNQKGKTILVIGNNLSQKKKLKKKRFEKKFKIKIEFMELKSRNGIFNLKQVFKELGKKNLASILVEGGQILNTSLLNQKLADQVLIAVTPVIFQTGTYFVDVKKAKRLNLKIQKINKLGKDILIECRN